MKIELSVVLPVYNEEKRIVNGLDHFYSYLKKQKFPWEIIVVNDGSTDSTLKVVKNVAKAKRNIKIISYEKNRGKGYAICQGVKNSVGEYILFSDIDHSVPIQTIETFFNYFHKSLPVIIGSRRVSGAVIKKHQSFIRETLGRGFTSIVQLIIDPQIKDATCGFKAFKKLQAQATRQWLAIKYALQKNLVGFAY